MASVCERCGAAYNPATAVGRWECRRHAAPHPVYDARIHEVAYACCGYCPIMHSTLRTTSDPRLMPYRDFAQPEDRRGCLRVDHGSNDASTVAVRTVDAHGAVPGAYVRAVPAADIDDADPQVAAVVARTYASRVFQEQHVLAAGLGTYATLVADARRQRALEWRSLGALAYAHGLSDEGDAGMDDTSLVAHYWRDLASAAVRPRVSVTVLRCEDTRPDRQTLSNQAVIWTAFGAGAPHS